MERSLDSMLRRRVIVMLSSIVVFGVAQHTLCEDASLDGHIIWRFHGDEFLEQLGSTIADAGDVDGDRVHDVIAGIVNRISGGPLRSAAVFSGASGERVVDFPWAGLQEPTTMHGVAGWGDLTGDGRVDLAIGSPGAGPGPGALAGILRIFGLGPLAFIQNPAPGAALALAMDGMHDFDGDGLADLLVGAPDINQVYIISGLPPHKVLVTLEGGQERERFGASVAWIGRNPRDLGVAGGRVVIGAPFFEDPPGTERGRLYVFDPARSKDPIWTLDGHRDGYHLGIDVDGGVDVDEDGFPDYLGSAIGSDLLDAPGSGEVFVFSGNGGGQIVRITDPEVGSLFGYSASFAGRCERPQVVVGAPQAFQPWRGLPTGKVELFDALDGTLLKTFYGGSAYEGFGMQVAGIEDVNADGSDDIVVGCPGCDTVGEPLSSGVTYVLSCTYRAQPRLVVDPPVAVFFEQLTTGASTQETVRLTNAGDADLVVSSLALAQGTNTAYSFGDLPLPLNLAPGAHRELSVRFAPAAVGFSAGTLTIGSNDPATQSLGYPVALHGAADEIKIKVVPKSIKFGEIDHGTSDWRTLTVKSVGGLRLTVAAMELDGDDAFSLGDLPSFPAHLEPQQSFNVTVLFSPAAEAQYAGEITVSSDDPAEREIAVPVSGTGGPQEEPPIAAFRMDVPYERELASRIKFRGDQSLDPEELPLAYFWEFGDGETAVVPRPRHDFPVPPAEEGIRRYVTKLTVTDAVGQTDATSVLIPMAQDILCCRFYGRAQFGTLPVPDGTKVTAWIGGTRVAKAYTQEHLGRSVYALSIPPGMGSVGPPGGEDGDTVRFRFRGKYMDATGTWYQGTDQEVHLIIPFAVGGGVEQEPPGGDDGGLECLPALGGSAPCFAAEELPPGGYDVHFAIVENPTHPPPPWRFVGEPVELRFMDKKSGGIVRDVNFTLRAAYTTTQLAALGVAGPEELAFHRLDGGGWVREPTVFSRVAGRVAAAVNGPGVYALLGRSAAQPGSFHRGDVNADSAVDLSDGISVIEYLFLGGKRPSCRDAADSNDDGNVDLSDATRIFAYLFLGGSAPASPGPGSCGQDPTEDDLDCASYEPCE